MRNGQREKARVRSKGIWQKHHLRTERDQELHLRPALVTGDTVTLGERGELVCRG